MQSVELERPVNITNTAPVLVQVETDVCGNVISYTETLARTLTAGDWTPVQVDDGIGDLYASIGCTFTNGVASCAGVSPSVAASDDFQSQIPETDEARPDFQPPEFEEPEIEVSTEGNE